jgi:hypothetical protein
MGTLNSGNQKTLGRFYHGGWIKSLIQRRFVKEFEFKDNLLQGLPLCVGLLCNLGRIVITNIRIKSSNQHEGLLNKFPAPPGIGFYSGDTTICEGAGAVRETFNRFVQAMGNEWEGDVQLKVTIPAANGYGLRESLNINAGLDEHLAHDRINLSGHDG